MANDPSDRLNGLVQSIKSRNPGPLHLVAADHEEAIRLAIYSGEHQLAGELIESYRTCWKSRCRMRYAVTAISIQEPCSGDPGSSMMPCDAMPWPVKPLKRMAISTLRLAVSWPTALSCGPGAITVSHLSSCNGRKRVSGSEGIPPL